MNIKSALTTVGLTGMIGVASVYGGAPLVDGSLDAFEGYDGPLTTQKSNVIDFLNGSIAKLTIQTNNANVGGKGGYDGGDGVSILPFPSEPETVETGVELCISLDELNFAAGAGASIRVCAFVNGLGHDFLSNQVTGGLGGESENLGEPRDVNFASLPGTSFVDIPLTGGPAAAPTIDGDLNGDAYGAPLWIQDIGTGFGDNNNSGPDVATGSEIDALYGYVYDGNLYILLTGNLSTNFNKLDMFFDVNGQGQNRLRGDNPDVDFDGLNRMGDDGSMNGLTFETGFAADYWVSYTLGNDPVEHYLNAAELATGGGGDGAFVGGGLKTGPISATGPRGVGDITITSDNSNILGVGGRTTTSGAGSEVDESDPALVDTGVEFVVNLAGIGYDTSGGAGSLDFVTMLLDSSWGAMSNQITGGLTSMTDMDPGNQTPAREVDLNQWDGDQFLTVSVPGSFSNPGITVDGSLDGAYGAPMWVNTTNGSSLGSNTLSDVDDADGSELCAVYTAVGLFNGEPSLYVFCAGNLGEYHRLVSFFDTRAGGRNDLRGDHPNIDFNNLNNNLGGPDGFTFDAGFEADYCVSYHLGFNGTDGFVTHFADGAEILTDGGGFGGRFGGGEKTATPIAGQLAPQVGFSDNDDATPGVSNGNEIDAIYMTVNGTNACFFIAGNLASDFTALDIFIDSIPGQGQNTIAYDDPATPEDEGNPNVDFNALNRMGGPVTFIDDSDPENPMVVTLNDGLTFDSGFAPDFWIGVKTGNVNAGQASVYLNYARLRVDAMDGGEGYFLGEGVTGGFGFLVGADAMAPLASLDINNSNVAGVAGSENPWDGGGTNPATVNKGIEFCIPLTALNWNGVDEIFVTAFISGQGHDVVSNQVAQSVCSTDLGEVRDVNFEDIDGAQYFSYNPVTGTNSVAGITDCVEPAAPCEGDADGNDTVNFDDLNLVLANWNSSVTPGTMGDVAPFPGGDGVVNFDDLNLVLGRWNQSCP